MGFSFLLLLMISFSAEAMLFSVELALPRYVPQGGSALLRCEYSVQREALHKVEWLRGQNKLLQFVKNRKPPFRQYAIVGAVIDMKHSNESQIMLRNLNLDASGYYSCEVSTLHPIFTKASNDEEITVFQPQRSAPEVRIRKSMYFLGDLLEANCTSSPAHPVPHITWLLNGATVPESALRFFPSEQQSSATVQLSLPVEPGHVGAHGRLQLVCVAAIPPFQGPRSHPREYADYQMQEASVEVVIPQSGSHQGRATAGSWALPLALLLAVFLGRR